MQCRHTVPDWHRYVKPAEAAVPILAGCRLLVKGEEPATDPRSITCTYWGHQRDCPLFDGPGALARAPIGGTAPPRSSDMPVAMETIWPVRAPGAKDGMRLVLIGLGLLSMALLLWLGLLGLSVLGGKAAPFSVPHVIVAAVAISILTHVLATLRTWGRR